MRYLNEEIAFATVFGSRGNEESCTILNGRQVSYKGEPWFLSNLINKLLDRTWSYGWIALLVFQRQKS